MARITYEVKCDDSFSCATFDRIRASAKVGADTALRRALLSKAYRMVAIGLELQGDIGGEWSIEDLGLDIYVTFVTDMMRPASTETVQLLMERVREAVR